MIVLHLARLARESFLWGEAAAMTSEHTPGRRSRSLAPPALPFGAKKETLASAVAEIAPGFRADAKAPDTRVVWLPSARGQPLASTPIIAETPERGAPISLAPWRVVVLRVKMPTPVDLLASTLDKKTVAPGVAVGGDWIFWANALRFASALVTRQKMLPGLSNGDDTWRARWDAVVAGADAERLEQLARAMPHACRALSDDASRPPASYSYARTFFEESLSISTRFQTLRQSKLRRTAHLPMHRRQPCAPPAMHRASEVLGDSRTLPLHPASFARWTLLGRDPLSQADVSCFTTTRYDKPFSSNSVGIHLNHSWRRLFGDSRQIHCW
jgi:hypothetical protein